ncbi:U3 small nucleolar RNA-associated protein 25-like [Setaria italica]|uniref:U3 small nucleolar RNA-associated protein 25-like n=1 Tax=Setaria italica TaxID=4555 RepID=UPI000BE4BC25|nr:U3 small nucleolar RNA-associated protein 25-like [Setaria italica]
MTASTSGGRVSGGRGGGKGTRGGRGGSRGGGKLGGGRGASSSGGHNYENPLDVDAGDEEDDKASETPSQEEDESEDDQWDEEDDDRDKYDRRVKAYILECRKKKRKIITIAAAILGMYHFETDMNKAEYRVAT